MTAVHWFIRITATILLLTALVIGTTGIVIGTEGGTRWLLEVAARKAPGELVVNGPKGTLLHGLRIDSLEWQSDTLKFSAATLLVDLDLLPLLSRRVDINRLEIQALHLHLESGGDQELDSGDTNVDLPVAISVASATIDELVVHRGGSEYRFNGTDLAAMLEGPRLDISRLRTVAFGLHVEAAGRMRLVADIRLRIDGQWRQVEGEAPGLAGRFGLDGTLRNLTFTHDLSAPFVVTSDGSVRLVDDAVEVDIANRWDHVDWSFDGQAFEANAGSLGLRGRLDSLTIDLETRARFADLPETTIDLDATTDLVALEIGRLLIENPWGIGEFSGTVTREPELAADFDFRLLRVDPSHFMAGLSGELAADGNASLQLAEDDFLISVRGDNIAGTLNDQFVTASTVFEYSPALLDVQYAEFRVGGNMLRATGRIAETLSVDAVLELNAIDKFVAGASGAAKATISLRDQAADPTARIEIAGDQLAYGAFRTDSLLLEINGSLADHAIDATLVRDGARLELIAGGSLEAQNWTGTVDSMALDLDTFGRWSSRHSARLAASPDAVSVDELCLAGPTNGTVACATFDHRTGVASEFDIAVEGFPVAALPLNIPPNLMVAGAIAAEARGTLVDGVLTAQGSVSASNTSVATDYEGEEARVDVSAASGTATVISNRLESTLVLGFDENAGEISASLDVADIFDPAAAIDGEALVSIRDVGFFAIFLPAITNPRGSIEGTLDISGSRDAPAMLGAVELRDGAFSVRPAGIEVTDMRLRAEQLADGELHLSGSARSGEGRVVVTGNTFFGTDTGIRSEVSIDGSDFELLRLPDWRMAASPDIDIVFDERATTVTGSLAIPTAAITVKTIPETAVRPSPDATVHVAGATERRTGRQIDVDVDTRLGDDVKFSGFGLTTGLAGAVRVQGGSQRPYLGFGQVDLIAGRYEAYGQDLTIERGQLIFNGPLADPNLDIRATRTIDDIVAGIHVTGQPSRLRSEVFSEPRLSDAETLSYLITGRPLSGSTTSAEGDLLNKAAFALGMSQAGSVASQIGGALGLESLSVEGGADSGRIVAGKRIGGRLFVEYGYGLVDKLGTLLLRYRINNRLMLESRTGTVSNLDIVYSVKKQ